MRERLRAWYGRPPADRPGDVMRWVRRVTVTTSAFGVLFGLQLWLSDMPLWWLVAGFGVLGLLNAFTMKPAIRRADARQCEPRPPAEVIERRRRKALTWMFVLYAVLLGGLAYALAGVVAMLVCVALVAITLPLGVALARRWPQA